MVHSRSVHLKGVVTRFFNFCTEVRSLREVLWRVLNRSEYPKKLMARLWCTWRSSGTNVSFSCSVKCFVFLKAHFGGAGTVGVVKPLAFSLGVLWSNKKQNITINVSLFVWFVLSIHWVATIELLLSPATFTHNGLHLPFRFNYKTTAAWLSWRALSPFTKNLIIR